MLWTAINRRTLLGLVAGGLAWPLVPLRLQAAPRHRVYLSARADDSGGYRVAGFTPDGRPTFDLPLPARGHSFAVHPRGETFVHFARRPGTFARVIDLRRGVVAHELTAPPNRHFYGHGVFSRDGSLLYATENDFEEGHGVLGLYDTARDYRRIGEIPSHGIGPHDVRLLSDGNTLAIANGGIQTRPDLPRLKLNLPTMAPSLTYVDRRDGTLLKEVKLAPDFHQLSIRHVAVGRDDRVAIAMQYEGAAGDAVPLVASHQGDAPVHFARSPEGVLRRMHQYCGSVAFDSRGDVFAVSSPRGGIVTFWRAADGGFLSSVSVPDGCGVASAPRPATFLVSSGQGGVITVDAHTGKSTPLVSEFLEGGHWDNHIVVADGQA